MCVSNGCSARLGSVSATPTRARGRLESTCCVQGRSALFADSARFEPSSGSVHVPSGRVLAERGHTKRAARICNDAIEMLDDRGHGGNKALCAGREYAGAGVQPRPPVTGCLASNRNCSCLFRTSGRPPWAGIGQAAGRGGTAPPGRCLHEDPPHSRSYRDRNRTFQSCQSGICVMRCGYSKKSRPSASKILRQIEAHNELARSLREQAHYLVKQAGDALPCGTDAQQHTKLERKAERLLKEATEHFQQRLTLAQEQEHSILVLDAQWGIAKVAIRRSASSLSRNTENRTDEGVTSSKLP